MKSLATPREAASASNVVQQIFCSQSQGAVRQGSQAASAGRRQGFPLVCGHCRKQSCRLPSKAERRSKAPPSPPSPRAKHRRQYHERHMPWLWGKRGHSRQFVCVARFVQSRQLQLVQTLRHPRGRQQPAASSPRFLSQAASLLQPCGHPADLLLTRSLRRAVPRMLPKAAVTHPPRGAEAPSTVTAPSRWCALHPAVS